jgi:ABC-type multidrug transport system ATPase subunit
VSGGLSSEQRKRLTVAVELVAAPRCLFLDEPTSGLDSRGAALVARVMRGVSRQGVAVVSTIHQPSREIFACFDELLLLQVSAACSAARCGGQRRVLLACTCVTGH